MRRPIMLILWTYIQYDANYALITALNYFRLFSLHNMEEFSHLPDESHVVVIEFSATSSLP